MFPATSSRQLRAAVLACPILVLLVTILSFYSTDHFSLPHAITHPPAAPQPAQTALDLPSLQDTAEYFVDFPVVSPFKEAFGTVGRRARVLHKWITTADSLPPTSPTRPALQTAIEDVAMSLFPFLKNYTSPSASSIWGKQSSTPLSDLRASFEPGSAGIVIPTGDNTARFAGHLIASLRTVLGTALPIQIVYAGDEDLSPASREKLASVAGPDAAAPALEFLDISSLLADDSNMQVQKNKEQEDKAKQGDQQEQQKEPEPPKPLPLQAPFFRFRDHPSGGGWALKSFAALASRFEKVILLDADAVFLQPPEAMLSQKRFRDTGALLFHDRLLWPNAFASRHDWFHDQIRRPSAELERSLVWSERYAEEGDSGAVVLDKSRVDVLMGLLHTCWQNTYAVRDEVTYKIVYGDKESWWMGLELAGAAYAMEEHYGSIVGWIQEKPKPKPQPGQRDVEGRRSGGDMARRESTKVCSFVIAHVDEAKKLLWYNGSLMKNKAAPIQEGEDPYQVPSHWMVDGNWEKGGRKQDMSCMSGAQAHSLTESETSVLQRSIDVARKVDKAFA